MTPLDDVKGYDSTGKEYTPRELIKHGLSKGMTMDGQVFLQIRMNGRIDTWTVCAITKEAFESAMKFIAEKVYT